MSLLGPLRDALGVYRRRKLHSLDRTVAGVEYNRYRRGYNRTGFDPHSTAGLGGMLAPYERDPGEPEFPGVDYVPYEWQMASHPTPPLRLEPIDEPEAPRLPTYEDSARVFQVTDRLMRELYASDGEESLALQESEPRPTDAGSRAAEPAKRPESLDGLVDALWAPMAAAHEIEAAMTQQMAETEMPPAPEPQPPEEDPWEMQRRMYDEQLQAMTNQLGMMMGPGPMM